MWFYIDWNYLFKYLLSNIETVYHVVGNVLQFYFEIQTLLHIINIYIDYYMYNSDYISILKTIIILISEHAYMYVIKASYVVIN